jgi:hypothetical protein
LFEKVKPVAFEKLEEASAWLKVTPEGLERLGAFKVPPSLHAKAEQIRKIKTGFVFIN